MPGKRVTYHILRLASMMEVNHFQKAGGYTMRDHEAMTGSQDLITESIPSVTRQECEAERSIREQAGVNLSTAGQTSG